MTRRRVIVLVLATLAAFGGIFWWIASKLERVEVERIEDISKEAQRNPFLAARRFLNRAGYDAHTTSLIDALDEPPPARDAIVVTFSEDVFTADRTERVLNWVESGGHLVLELYTPYDKENETVPQLLVDLGIRAHRGEIDPEHPENQPRQDFDLLQTGAGESFELEWLGTATLHDESGGAELWKVADTAKVARFNFGDGLVTVIADRYIFMNDAIGTRDHAAFLTRIVGPPAGKVWMIYRATMPGLLVLAWRHGWMVVIGTALTLLLALWGMYNRFGPLHVRADLRRRSLREHFDATARFVWRYNRAENLLHSVRQEIYHLAERRDPAWQVKTPAERIAWLAQRVQHDAAAVRDALHEPAREGERFIVHVSLLQKMRKSL